MQSAINEYAKYALVNCIIVIINGESFNIPADVVNVIPTQRPECTSRTFGRVFADFFNRRLVCKNQSIDDLIYLIRYIGGTNNYEFANRINEIGIYVYNELNKKYRLKFLHSVINGLCFTEDMIRFNKGIEYINNLMTYYGYKSDYTEYYLDETKHGIVRAMIADIIYTKTISDNKPRFIPAIHYDYMMDSFDPGEKTALVTFYRRMDD